MNAADRSESMKKRAPKVFAAALAGALALGSFTVKVNAQEQDHQQDFDHDHDHDFRGFARGSIVLSGTVYVGNADTVTPGEVLPSAA